MPTGEIFFEPDSTKGNSGPAASATFQNGQYTLEADNGHTGGPMTVRIIGYDGKPPEGPEASMNPNGMQLFPPYRSEIDLPREPSTRDFSISRQQ